MDNKEIRLKSSLNGKYKVNGFEVVINTNLPYLCCVNEENKNEVYSYYGKDALNEIDILETINNIEKNLTSKDVVGIYIDLCLK